MVKILERFVADHSVPSNLSISVAVREDENDVAEFARVKDALLQWQSSRDTGLDTLAIEIETEEVRRHETLNLFLNIVSEIDPRIDRLYKSVKEVEISLVSPSGRRIKKLGFSNSPG
jgi:hypothetical protein